MSGPRPTRRAVGRVHRFLTRAMRRATGMPLGRGGRALRLDQGIVRHGSGEESPSRHGARGTPHGPSSARPPARSAGHERDLRNDQPATFTGRRFTSPSLRDVSEWAGRIASGVPGIRRALPAACPRRPPPGTDSSGRLALIAWIDMTYRGGAPNRSGPCHRRGFRPRRVGLARPKPRIGPGGRGPAAGIETTGRAWVVWGRALVTTGSPRTRPVPVLKGRRPRPPRRTPDRTGPARGASAGASSG
jgi:hypothetical protein